MTVSHIPVNPIHSVPDIGNDPQDFAFHTERRNTAGMERIKILRKMRGLSQAELGDMCNLTQSMISKIEKGIANPTLDVLESISAALDVKTADLFERDELMDRAVTALLRVSREKQMTAVQLLESLQPEKSP
ncbi:helix-turn-helix transcriptional regulator [Mangrovicoccus sp. HB182678]|uniref:Helix-turn-helix transcriptional regulator n=2 Tax=Mangrovicoccus algicola TaxID=2771008 RepID=A0A8J7CZ79_9RHOB|nr:helix-turn-helix transcriptional regulator [Mangrovicoccus algicola]